MSETVTILTKIAERYGIEPKVWGRSATFVLPNEEAANLQSDLELAIPSRVSVSIRQTKPFRKTVSVSW